MTEHLFSFLQWLIPSGGVGAVVVWLTSRRLREVRTIKEAHDTYKLMYEDVRTTLLQLQTDNTTLYATLSRLEQAVQRATLCRYYGAACPLRSELLNRSPQHSQPPPSGAVYRPSDGQHRPRDGRLDEPSHRRRHSGADAPDDRPP